MCFNVNLEERTDLDTYAQSYALAYTFCNTEHGKYFFPVYC